MPLHSPELNLRPAISKPAACSAPRIRCCNLYRNISLSVSEGAGQDFKPLTDLSEPDTASSISNLQRYFTK